jgi:hypothetical protein
MKTNNYLLKTIKTSTNGIILWVLILASFLVDSCATNDIVRDWNSTEEPKQNIESIMIMGLVNQVSLRSDTEYEMADAARKTGLKPTISMTMFPPQFGKPFDDTERIKERLQERGIDAILTVAIIDIKAERYVGPEKTYVPLVYYDRFTNYYYRTEAVVYKPGYFTLQTRYFLETNLYEVKSGKLIWSGRSYAFDPQDFESFLPKYAKRLFKELGKTDITSIN